MSFSLSCLYYDLNEINAIEAHIKKIANKFLVERQNNAKKVFFFLVSINKVTKARRRIHQK